MAPPKKKLWGRQKFFARGKNIEIANKPLKNKANIIKWR
jgi:hypothetical protein